MGQSATREADSSSSSTPTNDAALMAWNRAVDEIYSEYDRSHAGSIEKADMISFTRNVGVVSEEEATQGADAFFALVAPDQETVSREMLDQFLKARIIKAGHHGVPHMDDVQQLRNTFDVSLAHIPGHIKLMRQTSDEYRQRHNTCHICRTQKPVQQLYSLKGSTHKLHDEKGATKQTPEVDNMSMLPLVRQTSQDFIQSLSMRMCNHSFCLGCLRKNVRHQIVGPDESSSSSSSSSSRIPVCPVCDEFLGLMDLENILTETEFVSYLCKECPLHALPVPMKITTCPTCKSTVTDATTKMKTNRNKDTSTDMKPSTTNTKTPADTTNVTADAKTTTENRTNPEAEQSMSQFVCECKACGILCALCGEANHSSPSTLCTLALLERVQRILADIDQLKGLPNLFAPPKTESEKEAQKKSAADAKAAAAKTSSGKAGVGYGGAGDVDNDWSDDSDDEWWDEDEFGTSARAQVDAQARAAGRQAWKERHIKEAALVATLTQCLNNGSLRTNVPLQLFALLLQSRLNRHLADFYRTGFMEMASHAEFGDAMLDLTRVIALNPLLLPLLRPDGQELNTDQTTLYPVVKCMQDTLKQAKLVTRTSDKKAVKLKDAQKRKDKKENKDEKETQDEKENKAKASTSNKQQQQQAAAAAASSNNNKQRQQPPKKEEEDMEELRVMSLAEKLKLTNGVVNAQCKAYLKLKQLLPLEEKKESEDGDSKDKESGIDKDRIDIEEFMRCQSLTTSNITGHGAPLKHIFAKEFKGSQQEKAGRRMMRIRQEMAALSNSLPPGIFVSFDQNRFDVLRCLIIGAEGTPYQNGCFLFDMYIPPAYPSVPPKCKIITTGKASFRFNANLYKNGKVCLSLLGTWQGPGWDPEMSTIMQVLLSIQAMIMCEDPIQNEPGWEHKVGRPQGDRYDRSIRHATLLYALKWHLTDPPYGFEDVVKCHCWLNKDALLKQITEWEAEEAKPCSAKPGCNYRGEDEVKQETFAQTASSLRELLQALLKPNVSIDSDDSSDDDDSDDDSDDE